MMNEINTLSAWPDGSATAPKAAHSSTLLQPAGLNLPTPAEEAAWQLLKGFISPIDCNVFWQFQDLDGTIIQGIRAMNVNTTMNALLNGDKVPLAYFTKKRFLQHCRGTAKYYYRSKWNGFASTGYGGHANAWKKLKCDASRYALDGKKVSSKTTAVLLLGFDVDAHNGEKDVQKTTDLILDLFPGSYHEPSTNGLGEHIYVKIYYDVHAIAGSHYATLHHIHSICTIIATGIELRRQHLGYDAMLDQIRGLPTLIGFEKQDGKPVMSKRTLPDGRIIEKPRLKVTRRSLVIKTPFYRNCTEESVLQFFQAPFFNIKHLDDIQATMIAQGIGYPEYEYDDCMERYINDLYAGEALAEPRGDKHPPIYTHHSVFPGALDYITEARNLTTIMNSHERRTEFGMLYARHLGRIPTGGELEAEYGKLGLTRSDSQSDRTSFRFDQISRWLSQWFKPEKCRFGYGGYTFEKDQTEERMEKRVSGMKLEWTKGDGIVRTIRVSKLAALYWCMRHSQGRKSSTQFSRQQAKTSVLESLKVKSHNAEVAAMFRILQQVGLIENIYDSYPGQRARGWVVNELT